MTDKSPAKEDIAMRKYFETAQTWDQERNGMLEQSEKRAWKVTWWSLRFALVCGFIVLFALWMLSQKKEKTTVLVADKATGNIEQMTTLEEARVELDEVFIISFLTKFMHAFEGYNPTMNEENYYTAAVFLCPNLQSDWHEQWNPNNPRSLDKRYGRDTIKRIDLPSIVINKSDDGTKKTATIRFSTYLVKAGQAEARENFIANLSYQYNEVSTSTRERRINPVGFCISSYQKDPELGGVIQPGPAQPAPASPAVPAVLPAGAQL